MGILKLNTDGTDDDDFVSLVNQIVWGAVITHQPSQVCVFKIDNWFDHKWLAFSGKFLGAVGSWRKPITVPPFVTNRIIAQWHFKHDAVAGTYVLEVKQRNIHHTGRAEKNLRRAARQVAPDTALFWFSGNTCDTGRGSLMGYIPVKEEIWTWFLAFVRKDGWRIARRKLIHDYEVRLFQSAGEESLVETMPQLISDEE